MACYQVGNKKLPFVKQGLKLLCASFIVSTGALLSTPLPAYGEQNLTENISRADYGNSHFPIWSELSYFERTALSDLHLAQANNPDALLALYLVASGVRDLAEYETVNRRISAFVSTLKEAETSTDTPYQLGERINREMHNAFFLKEGKGKAPSGYATDQSRLMGIFETSEFNCISSAMLYTVLARHFNLSVQGVLLPSHAFVQLNTPKGAVDVETTSAQGFDQPHNEAFYEKQSSQWHELRGLEPATYEDYLNRQRVSPTVLAAKNMLNQHTREQQMDITDSARLAEISAYIYPENPLAQEKRLFLYNTEQRQLSQQKSWSTLARMYQTTYKQTLQDAYNIDYPESLVGPLMYFELGALLTYSNMGDANATLETLEALLQRHPAVPEKQEEVESHIVHSINTLVGVMVDTHQFEDALLVLATAELATAGLLPKTQEAWPKIIRWTYLSWVNYFWKQNQWQDVIYTAQEWLEHTSLPPQDAQALEALSTAYQQLVIGALENNEPETAEAHIELCNMSHPESTCTAASKMLKQFIATQKQDEKKPKR